MGLPPRDFKDRSCPGPFVAIRSNPYITSNLNCGYTPVSSAHVFAVSRMITLRPLQKPLQSCNWNDAVMGHQREKFCSSIRTFASVCVWLHLVVKLGVLGVDHLRLFASFSICSHPNLPKIFPIPTRGSVAPLPAHSHAPNRLPLRSRAGRQWAGESPISVTRPPALRISASESRCGPGSTYA